MDRVGTVWRLLQEAEERREPHTFSTLHKTQSTSHDGTQLQYIRLDTLNKVFFFSILIHQFNLCLFVSEHPTSSYFIYQ